MSNTETSSESINNNGREIEELVATFLENFENPVSTLYLDEGEHIWITEQWSTEDALHQIFDDDLEDSIFEELRSCLDEMSTEWASTAEWLEQTE